MSTTPARRKLVLLMALPLTMALGLGVAFAQTTGTEVDRPDEFTSAFSVRATGDEVPPPGEDDDTDDEGNADASGRYDLMLNADMDVICFDIEIAGATDNPQSPAPTANHLHDGAAGEVGPPVVLFPNPEMDGAGNLITEGCLESPYVADSDVTLADIEADPVAYYADYHTEEFPRGDVRGQLSASILDDAVEDDPMPAEGEGVAAGFGGAADDGGLPIGLLTIALVLLLGAGGAVAVAGRRGSA